LGNRGHGVAVVAMACWVRTDGDDAIAGTGAPVVIADRGGGGRGIEQAVHAGREESARGHIGAAVSEIENLLRRSNLGERVVVGRKMLRARWCRKGMCTVE